jgi:hypothetical protein
MITAFSLILAIMLSIGGTPAVGPGDTGIQAPIANSCTINRFFEDYSQKTASRLFPKKIPEIVLIDQPKTQIRLIFTLPLKEKPLLMGYEDSMNLYQAFNMNPINFTDPFGEDVLGACAESNKYYLYPTENKEIIEAKNRALALFGEGAANAAVKTFLLPAKYITLPLRLMFGFDFDVNVNYTRDGSVIGGYFGKQNRLDIVKEQTVVYPLADFVTQTGYDAYFGLIHQGGSSPLGESSRENLARSAGALEFNTLFWGNVYKKTTEQATYNYSGNAQWLDDLKFGNNYNKAHAFDYPYRELYIENPKGGYYILDGYTTARSIVSRKFTQLGEISESTAISYVNELARKYPQNAKIANVPSSGPLAGTRLRGQLILEVPSQVRPIPQSVINAANSKGVKIRDVFGNEYN